MSDDSTGSSDRERPIHALYAVALQQARKSGDLRQMRELAERARTEGGDDPEIRSALSDLEAEIDGAGNS